MKVTDAPIIIEQKFDKPVNDVWKAITELNQMRHWFFENIPDFKAEVGFKTQFNVEAPSRGFMHLWEVTEIVPNKKIVVNWKFEGLQGSSFVSFELFEKEKQTKLVLTAKAIIDFDESIPEFKRESGVEGWTYFINNRLAEFLKK